MAYTAGDLILRDEYNVFATGNADGTANHAVANINTVWGVGNGDKGYGQSTVLSAVSAGDIVTATQWSTLLSRLNSILTHQSGSGSGITSPVAGNTITALATLATNITTAYNNRANFNNTRSTVTSDSTRNGTWNAASPTTFSQVRTVTFTSADTARYFFNAGGRLQLKLSATGAAGTTKETNWVTLINTNLAAMNLDFTTSGRTGTGATLTTNGSAIGYWDLTTVDQTLIRLTEDTAPYTANYLDILCKVAGAAGSNGGLGTQVIFTVNYVDGATDVLNDSVNLTINCQVDVYKPETTNLTDVVGSVTVASTTN